MVPISFRMKAIADLVPNGMSVADIGCDHGFVAIYLVTEKGAPKAIAMDINEGPLLRAAEHIEQYNLTDVITTRLSDGAVGLNYGEVDAAVIAGMGGKLTVKIISESLEKFKAMKCFVLSPHSDIPFVRDYLYLHGFAIEDENMVFDEGKYYTMMRCIVADESIDSDGITYGPKLIEKKNPVLIEYLNQKIDKHEELIDKLALSLRQAPDAKKHALITRQKDLEIEINIINRILSQM